MPRIELLLVVFVFSDIIVSGVSSTWSSGCINDDLWCNLDTLGNCFHKPIHINGNKGFNSSNGVSSGNGSIDNPYIIQGFTIELSLFDILRQKELAGILVENTDVYFIIKDVKIESLDGIISYYLFKKGLGRWIYALKLHNVTHGVIKDVEITGCYQAINVENNSYGNIIDGVMVARSFCGIGVNRGSDHNIVQNCHTKTYGCGICLWDNVSGNIVRNCSCKLSGFNIHKSHDNMVINCTALHCGRHGVSIYGNEGFGLRIYLGSYNNTVRNCVFMDNQLGVKIYDESNGNKVYYNDFIDNDRQAYDECYNSWDNGYQGNYWSDYQDEDLDGNGIWDHPYSIPGGLNIDRYPLTRRVN